MYDAFADPACHVGSNVLKNIPGLRSQPVLDRFEAVATGRRFLEPCRLAAKAFATTRRSTATFSKTCTAGQVGSKGDSMFCYPEHLATETGRVFDELRKARHLRGRDADGFAHGAAHFLGELNAIHPFRDGNGRSQLTFLRSLADQAAHPLDFRNFQPEAFLEAMIDSFHGDERPLTRTIERLIT